MDTSTFDAHGVTFTVSSTDAAVVAAFDDLLVDFRRDGTSLAPPVLQFSAEPTQPDHTDLTDHTWYRVMVGDDVVYTSLLEGSLVSHLLMDVNARAAAACRNDGTVPLHAGTVAGAHGAIVLPGASHSGKTTITTALAAAGHRFVADEVSRLDPDALTIAPYGKPVALRAASVELLAPSIARLRRPGSRFEIDERFVPPSELGASVSGDTPPITSAIAKQPVAVSAIVFPRYDATGPHRFAPLGPAETLERLMQCTLGVASTPVGADVFRILERLVRAVPGHELVYTDLNAALDEFVPLMADPRDPHPRGEARYRSCVVEPAPRGPQRIKRRDALRLLAASSGAVAGGSLIVSGPAHADIGSEPCLFAFSGPAVVTISAFNTTIFGDFVTLTMSAVPGSCPCGASASIQYAFHLTAPLATATSGPWSATNSYSLSFANLWPAGGGSFTVSAGVRVTCSGPTGTTVRCRFASGIFNMPASFGSVNTTFQLPTNNGNSPFPNLPTCNPVALRMAALSGDGLTMVPGVAASPPELQALIDGAPELQPIDVLAEQPQPDAAQSSADNAATETTSTTAPKRAPETTPSTTTPTATTPTTITSTAISDSTTTSTTPAD